MQEPLNPLTPNPSDASNEEAWRVPQWLYLPAVLAVCIFFWRGPINGMSPGHGGDFDVVSLVTRAWLHGQNPYQYENLRPAYEETKMDTERPADPRWLVALYPPSLYPVMAPLALFDRDTGRHIMIALNLVMTMVILWLLPTVAGVQDSAKWTTLLRIAVLLLAPLWTAINMGQTALLVAALLVAGVWCRQRGYRVAGGVLLGIATAVKVNVALPFVAYELCRGRWRVSLVALAVAATLLFVGVLPLQVNHPGWFDAMRANMHALLLDGGFGDPTRLNPTRHHLINLHYALHTLTGNRTLVNAITLGFVAVPALLTVWLLRRCKDGTRDLLGLSMVSVLCLLLTYHRFYDAVILIFPLAWVMRGLMTSLPAAASRWRTIPLATLLLCVTFVIPGAVVLRRLARQGIVPPTVHRTAFWDVLVMPHQVWVLSVMALVFLLALSKGKERTTEAQRTQRSQERGGEKIE